MKVDLDTKLKNLDGSDYKEGNKEITLGLVLSSCLDSSSEGGRMKLYVLAKKCYKGGKAEFDSADIALLKKSVEQSSIKSNLIVGQVLEMLENVKE